MFKKFNDQESVLSINNAKSSVCKTIRNAVAEKYATEDFKNYMDIILPKKDTLKFIKCQDHVELYANGQGELVFFKFRDGPFFPTLKTLHKFPFLLPHFQVDKGAIPFVLKGSNIMCPGLTSKGGKMTNLPKGSVVAIMAEGKSHALAVGVTTMSTDEIFNRGALLNVGVVESDLCQTKGCIMDHFDSKSIAHPDQSKYIALHDVDLLPMVSSVRYDCFEKLQHKQAIHLIPYWLSPVYHWFKYYSGGIMLISRKIYNKVNGMSNICWGWGREDDEFRIRLRNNDVALLRSNATNINSTHYAFKHLDLYEKQRDTKSYNHPKMMDMLKNQVGGLSTVNYSVVSRQEIVIAKVEAYLLNVQLHCDRHITPYCV